MKLTQYSLILMLLSITLAQGMDTGIPLPHQKPDTDEKFEANVKAIIKFCNEKQEKQQAQQTKSNLLISVKMENRCPDPSDPHFISWIENQFKKGRNKKNLG